LFLIAALIVTLLELQRHPPAPRRADHALGLRDVREHLYRAPCRRRPRTVYAGAAGHGRSGPAGLRLASPQGGDVGKEAKRFLPTCAAARVDPTRAAFFVHVIAYFRSGWDESARYSPLVGSDGRGSERL